MSDRIREKLNILADAAKYDVSCSSSGGTRKNDNKGPSSALTICSQGSSVDKGSSKTSFQQDFRLFSLPICSGFGNFQS